MFGGYTAGLQNENFFRLSAQYQEFQMRDIYEYKLKLSKYQKNLIISYTFEMNRNRVKIIEAKEIKNIKGKPGTLLDKNFTIACLNNAVRIYKLTMEGKKQITAQEFLRGYKIKIGELLT